MDREFSDELTGLMPHVLHGIAGVDCGGRVVAIVENTNVELRCDRCGAVVGVVQVGIMEGLLGLECDVATCPHCGNVNTLIDGESTVPHLCDHCGREFEA